MRDVVRMNNYDIIFIFREAFMTGSIFFEKFFKKSNAKLVFDFDDAIWLPVVSENNKAFSLFKDAAKTSKIISLCDLVFAGNQYLADYAFQFNKNTVVIPTTIDTELYMPAYQIEKPVITIGWSGSISTLQHFEHALPALRILKEKYREKINIKVIGDPNYIQSELGIRGLRWNAETEVKDLQEIDIGIMPLPNGEWTKGKCGLKGLQYMALEIPTLMSPVGVNTEIINDGVNGFLANNPDEWVNKLSLLIEKPELRLQLGKNGRRTVEERYSVSSQRERYLALFNQLTQG
jgi:glycosyltransferase involved in cell wall biosynthesis